jgi:hypothetical protein
VITWQAETQARFQGIFTLYATESFKERLGKIIKTIIKKSEFKNWVSERLYNFIQYISWGNLGAGTDRQKKRYTKDVLIVGMLEYYLSTHFLMLCKSQLKKTVNEIFWSHTYSFLSGTWPVAEFEVKIM